ncbi:hypothetical protein U2181_15565, partial [Listeria monocytogenes]
LLKVLEEPPKNVHFILTSSMQNSMLPTIMSRVACIDLKASNSRKMLDHYISEGYEKSEISKSIAMSGGLGGLTHKLLT